MQLNYSEELILDDILKTCTRLFGFRVVESVPIKRGWLNLKWKVTTDFGIFLIKQYNKKRLKRYNHSELLFAFSQQIRLNNEGLPSPKLMSHKGNSMFESDNGEFFIVMDYCEGEIIPPGKLNAEQMFDLGKVTGKMHQILNDKTLGEDRVPQFILPSREVRLEHWKSVQKKVIESNKLHLLPVIDSQYITTEAVDFLDFNVVETGWAHRDLWVDNLLFKGNQVSAVLDFDRLKYDYPQLDVARAVISGCLNERNTFNANLASAFVAGYRENCSFEQRNLVKSLRLLWYMESTWWVDENMDQHVGPPTRFSKEMIWLSKNYGELDSIAEND